MDRADAEPRATLAGVAARAGVSLKTASRAINGEQYVAEATRARVLDAAAELGFQLNAMASLLARGQSSNVVGLITGDLANPFYAALAKGVERAARAEGLRVLLASSDESSENELSIVDELARQHVRALVVASTLERHDRYRSVQERGIPVVFVDRAVRDLAADSVVLANRSGARAAAEHLLAHGHRRIAFLGDYGRLPTYRERLDGFGEALEAAGIDDWRDLVAEGTHDPETAQRRTAELLGRPDAPTAIFASNNRASIGVLRAFAELRPDNLPALVGFDDFDLAAFAGVTVVSFDAVELGRTAARLALDAVGRRRTSETGPGPRITELPTHLIARGSGERRPG